MVLDPKGEQWEPTAGERHACVGPVYQLPRDGLDLLAYYDLHTPLDLKELNTHLLRTDRDKEPIFVEKMCMHNSLIVTEVGYANL
ncbi:MAG: hypothetical protein NVSMB42_06660 [Herpetosiphon sp.]